jgi:hypothetical protein
MSKTDDQNPHDNNGASAPTIGEIEGRLLVLEFVALSCVTRLLHLHNAQERQDLVADVLRGIEVGGRNLGLHFRDIADAQGYAEDLLKDAQGQADGLEDVKHAWPGSRNDN